MLMDTLNIFLKSLKKEDSKSSKIPQGILPEIPPICHRFL